MHLISVISDIADDYIHISATMNSLSADDSTGSKKWVQYVNSQLLCRAITTKVCLIFKIESCSGTLGLAQNLLLCQFYVGFFL